ncbi:hypothetical protein Tco_0004773 [Tanacetum coccineum]
MISRLESFRVRKESNYKVNVKGQSIKSASVEPAWMVLFHEWNWLRQSREPAAAKSIKKGLFGPIGGSCSGKGGSYGGNGGRRGSMAGKGRGWFSKRLIDSNEGRGEGGLVVLRGEECLEGCVCASGKEVKGGGDDFRVSKSLLGEIPGVVIGKSSGETFGDNRGAV